jgi:excinuclease ABC subunit A
VVVVEHRPLLAARVDWIIELGPGAGPAGGTIIAEGTPQQISKLKTATGKVLEALFTD